MIDNDALHTAQDFEHAAFIFQHGTAADDYLLAHTLATIAVAKGRTSALWIVTATLDRYLGQIGSHKFMARRLTGPVNTLDTRTL
jgi:hypothetical protein